MPVGGITPERQIVWDQFKRYTNRPLHRRLISDFLAPSIHLYHSVSTNTLCQILIRRPDAYLLSAFIPRSCCCGRGECVIGLQFNHWPNDNPHTRERTLQRMKLCP